jgi:amino acid transporter
VNRTDKKIGYWEVVAIGIGGMVGGGIFAVLGLAVQLAHGGTPLAFGIAGLVAVFTTYSYAKLSVAFPSQGGTVTFLDRAFGAGVLVGSLNILLWVSYVVMLSLYSYAFGSYGATFLPAAWQALGRHLLMTASIVGITILNLMNAKAIGRAEGWIVGLKLTILIIFVGVGLRGISVPRLLPSAWAPPVQLVSGGFIIFLAYEGFELIANAAQDTREPRRTLPRAFYSAVFFVIALYVLVAIVTVGNLPVSQIVDARDYALAAAAKPFMGQAGFTLIAIAALLSTASAINATLYGASRLSYIIAVDGELPHTLEKKIWNQPILGLLITAALTTLVANLFSLSGISTMGSSGFLLIFAAVNFANVRLAKKTGSRHWISIIGVLSCLLALAALLWQTAHDAPLTILTLVGMLGLSVGIEVLNRMTSRRKRAAQNE